ncbi:MAG: hypothetical protein AB1422_12575 [bacterium]
MGGKEIGVRSDVFFTFYFLLPIFRRNQAEVCGYQPSRISNPQSRVPNLRGNKLAFHRFLGL